MFDAFHFFTRLPVELQTEIWTLAIRPTTPGVQTFSLSSKSGKELSENTAEDAPWAVTYHLTAPKWAFAPMSNRVCTFQETLASWTKNNPSTYLVDSGVWNACRHSHNVMRDIIKSRKPMVVKTKMVCGDLNVEASLPGGLPSSRRTVIVSPSQDLFILQLDRPDMLSWSLFDDIAPIDTVPKSIHVGHVGWQYHPAWAMSLRDSPWIGALDSLCSYIVYGIRFGGLETLWLINWRIKRKHWVPWKNEVERPSPKVFETDNLRFMEVILDENVESLDQLRWDEVGPEDGLYTVVDFLAFVRQLQLSVSHVLTATQSQQGPRRTMSVKVLACEERR
ncbi:uncharacterized protein FIESC28_05967 [Fusarium coffeatum]|uniref:2EXR domain-containing protein n=1 Tax=Fusarium coffeatum TaxID=231269 RepID=A0A366RQN4_9HYPO|nr:uncharacterized protein FIESC28_05967 [Fusarium coffeatum]RBR18615.1 hypothetical protein FIESC28_05967 [Fusarium coffeatum]